MEQHLGSAVLGDGTSVAYAVSGDGPVLVSVPGWLTHLELSWALPPERRFYESLSEGRTLVRYDKPGCGLSGPSARPPAMDLELEALAAVVDAVGATRFDVLGSSLGATVAVRWAAAHADTVERLVLYGGWSNGSAVATPEVREHVVGLVRTHWGLGTDVLADIFAPDASPALRSAFVRYQLACASAETASRMLELSYASDVEDVAGALEVPTLVVHRRDDRAVPVAQGRRLAEQIPGAAFCELEGRSHLPYIGDVGALSRAVRRFLGMPPLRRSLHPRLTPRQREVAGLVAEGLPNREIAARLGITERSAEGHVERIRLRLGFRSRAQIAAWVAAASDAPQ